MRSSRPSKALRNASDDRQVHCPQCSHASVLPMMKHSGCSKIKTSPAEMSVKATKPRLLPGMSTSRRRTPGLLAWCIQPYKTGYPVGYEHSATGVNCRLILGVLLGILVGHAELGVEKGRGPPVGQIWGPKPQTFTVKHTVHCMISPRAQRAVTSLHAFELTHWTPDWTHNGSGLVYSSQVLNTARAYPGERGAGP